jgi:hypothetical protein
MIGQDLTVGSAVVFRPSRQTELDVGRVVDFSPKMAKISQTINGREDLFYAYPSRCVVIPLDTYLAYAISRS